MQLFYEKHYRAQTPLALHLVITGGIQARLGWSLLKNRLRPGDQRRTKRVVHDFEVFRQLVYLA